MHDPVFIPGTLPYFRHRMTREELIGSIREKRSYLCVGLDTDIQKIPSFLRNTPDPVFEFNKRIIDATRAFCIAYKPNLAFYEAEGSKGWESLEKTVNYIGHTHFIIADAKRGDIGNTSVKYAEAFFRRMAFDAITVAPYMGKDSVQPFFAVPGKWVILLALTSNAGSADFQMLDAGGMKIYEHVISHAMQWGDPENLMFVIGATHPGQLRSLRMLAPDHFFLVPGIGAQGGNLQAISEAGMHGGCGLIVNASRSILYASSGEDFDTKAAEEASRLQKEMESLLRARDILA